MRCSILDGKSIKSKQKKGGFPVDHSLPDGPVFRILWGCGVDEEENDGDGSSMIDYPFDPAPPIVATGSVKTDALLKEANKIKSARFEPNKGMRVKVRLDKGEFCLGTIEDVQTKVSNGSGGISNNNSGNNNNNKNSKRKSKEVEITIAYDSGFSEKIKYPDPDVEVIVPGKENGVGPIRCMLLEAERSLNFIDSSLY